MIELRGSGRGVGAGKPQRRRVGQPNQLGQVLARGPVGRHPSRRQRLGDHALQLVEIRDVPRQQGRVRGAPVAGEDHRGAQRDELVQRLAQRT